MTTKRQHFVPQAFLKGFSESPGSPFIWVYDKRDGFKPSRKSVRSVAYEDYYYAQENEAGIQDSDSLEKALATTIDNDLPRIIQNLQVKPGHALNLSSDEKGKIAYFVGLSLTRVPSFREGINQIYSWAAQMALDSVAEEDQYISDLINKYGLTAEAKNWVSLRPMLQTAKSIGESILLKNWQFFVAAEKISFMTSDNPVVIGGQAGMGPAHPSAELMLSLRKDLALVCTPRGTRPIEVFNQTPSETKKFNRGIVRAARQRVFADRNSPTIDSFVKKYGDDHQRITS
ncbi:DUF4238 domain-containing protein [Pseudomonas syringae]|uniref:DUF4238 domain-containing protein n=1 Tax=Pseudomonas syringae TaxID=317 RepID=UPI0007EE471B|nr:DUF4238 domain-containing protein [Pseudomonas syringae]OBS34001.1 hypothetical protein A9K81_14915 [Pseudomonas syringae pv. syringae]